MTVASLLLEPAATAPAPKSYVTEALHEHLQENRRRKGPRPTSDGTRGRGSKARHCAREIALSANGAPTYKEPNDRSMIAFFVGQSVHDEIDKVMVRRYNARTEVPCSYKPTHDLSGNADFVYDVHPETGEHRPNLITGETKSMTKYMFMKSLGCDMWGKPYQVRKDGTINGVAGPKIDHLTQAALYGNSPQLQSDYLHLVYFCKDNGDMAEWILGLDEPLAHLGGVTPRSLAVAELARIDGIFGLVDSKILPARIHPDEGRIDVPTDDIFACRFCDYRPLCERLPADRCRIEDVEVAIELIDKESREAPVTTNPGEDLPLW